MTYCQPYLARFFAMKSAFALTSSSRTVGPQESQLFHPIGGVAPRTAGKELSANAGEKLKRATATQEQARRKRGQPLMNRKRFVHISSSTTSDDTAATQVLL